MASRRWLEILVRIPLNEDAADLLAEGLLELGGRAVEERDGWLVTYVEEPPFPDAFRERARAHLLRLSDLHGVDVAFGWRDHENWAESWKRGLAPRRLTDRIVVTPSWCEPSRRSGDIVVVLDPGMAFGTAEHGTTRGCIRLMNGCVKAGDHVLDVGAGSGILSIVAARLGAGRVIAVEGDPLACEAAEENLARNGVEDTVTLVPVWANAAWLVSQGPVHGVVANLESGLLRPLLPGLARALRSGGWLIVSGILASEWPRFSAEVKEHSFSAVRDDADGEWRSGLFRKA